MERLKGAVAIEIREALLSSASQNLDALSNEPMAADNFTFFRIPAHIRQRNKLLFEPRMVAIGPYGRSDELSLRVMECLNPSLREMEWVKPSLRAMEQLKRPYLQSFCSRSVTNMSIDDYKAEIQKLEPRARQCYFEPVELNTEKFVEMLLLDGCFILEFLIKWNRGDNDDMFAMEWSLPLIRGDLLLLENQIPLFVLDKLFELVTSTVDSMIPSSLKELLVGYLKVEKKREPLEAKDFHHLLHLYYCCYVTEPQTDPTGSTISSTVVKWLRPSRIFDLLLSCIRFKICRTDMKIKRSPRTIPSATALLVAGVTIKKKERKKNDQNRLSSFLDVTFHDGVLEIPFLSVEPSTLPRFSNLVAFEQCGGCKPHAAYMTSYAVFMGCLVNTPKDVAILNERGILENKLASDEELAVFFNQLSDWATLDFNNHYLAGLFQEVWEYCDSDWAKLRVMLVRDYFGNRWSFLSFLGAVAALVFTIVQTFFTVYPNK